MYNVLEKLRAGETFNDKDQKIHHAGLISVLKQIHDDLDTAVFAAYGWPPTLTDEQILERLVALNAERATEESHGLIRYLRPDFQAKSSPPTPSGTEAEKTSPPEPTPPTKKRRPRTLARRASEGEPRSIPNDPHPESPSSFIPQPSSSSKLPWPKELSARTRAIQDALSSATSPLTPADLASRYLRARADTVEDILTALTSLGLAHRHRGGTYSA